jgi:hypothetical protein
MPDELKLMGDLLRCQFIGGNSDMYRVMQTNRPLVRLHGSLTGRQSSKANFIVMQIRLNYTVDVQQNKTKERVPGCKRTVALHIGYIGNHFKGTVSQLRSTQKMDSPSLGM